MLPQHARMCGPLEAANGLGFLLYPAMADHESLQVRRSGPGAVELSFFGGDPQGPSHLFTLRLTLPAHGTGVYTEELVHLAGDCPFAEDEIPALREALVRSGSTWVPPGAMALRANVDVRTPPGWDSVFTGVLNLPQAPPLCTLSARVETDWYAFDTEFRSVLEVGDVLSATGRTPVGQVFVVPRTPVAARQATAEEAAAFRAEQGAFAAHKRTVRASTALGLEYDTAYREAARARAGAPGTGPLHPC